jgi:hypothetical protein
MSLEQKSGIKRGCSERMRKPIVLGMVLILVTVIFATLPTDVSASPKGIERGRPPGAGGDKAPRVRIKTPRDGATVSGIVPIEVTATDREDDALTVDLYLDSEFRTHANYYSWNTTEVADGSHVIYAEAVDSAGNIGSDLSAVMVDNNGGGTGDGIVLRHAVTVGINDYQNINDLEYAVNDADDWNGYLEQLQYTVTTLTDSQATEPAITSTLSSLISEADADDILVFAFSGHGDKDRGSQLLCTYENTYDNTEGALYDYELKDLFASTTCNVFIFLDCCYAGGMNEVMDNPNSENVYMTTTCGPSGYGYDAPMYENGLWTYWFEEAGLEQQFGSDPATTMEECFEWASARYPYRGQDAPVEFDGDTSTFFTL